MRIGVTGHQEFDDPSVVVWVEEQMSEHLAKFRKGLIGITCLAKGADQLFAKLVILNGGILQAVLPFADYERTMSGATLLEYYRLFAHSDVEVLANNGSDQEAFYAAGVRVVDLSDRVFAVWNGLPAKGKGGTADIVAYAVERNKPIIHFNTRERSVVNIY